MRILRYQPLRIALKLLAWAGGIMLLLLVAASVYIEVNKKTLLEKFRKEVSANLRSEVVFRDADITIWKNFPYIGLHLYDIHVEDSVYHQPFFTMKEVTGKISLLQYFKKDVELRDLSLKDGVLHLLTDSTGYTNKYLLQFKKPGAKKTSGEVILNHATLKNVQLIMENRKRNKRFDFIFHSLTAGIEKDGDVYAVSLHNDAVVNSMTFNREKGSYLEHQSIQMDIDLRYDTQQALLSFDEQEFKINAQTYLLKGRFSLRDEGYFTLSVKTRNAPYKKLQQVLSANIANKLAKCDMLAPIDASALLEGPLAYRTTPRITAQWTVTNNTLVTDVATFSQCSFKGSFTNENIKGGGFTDPNSAIVLRDFSGNWEGIPLKGKEISICNLKDPVIQFSLSSVLDVQLLNERLGLSSIRFTKGEAALQLAYSGALPKDISVLDQLHGQISLKNGTIQYLPRNFTFHNCSGTILFTDNNIAVNNLLFDLGTTHFVVNAAGNNLSGLGAKDVSKTSIRCNVYSPLLNIGELKGLFSKKTVVKRKANGGPSRLLGAAAKVDDIMDNGNLEILLNAPTVQYNNFTGKQFTGNILFENTRLLIKKVSLLHAGGSMELTGAVQQNGPGNHAHATVQLKDADVQKLFYAFNDFGQDGISSANIRGIFNGLVNVDLLVNESGVIEPGSMKGTVDFSLKKGALINYEPLQDIKNFVTKNKDMQHVYFAELKNRLVVDGHKILINKMEIQSSAIGMFVDGVYDAKKTGTKINIQVPLKGLKQRDSTYIPQNVGVDAKKGFSIYLLGKNDKKTGKVKFGLNTTRTIRKIF